jgi:type I restriction-modification system DNA methylase subunit
MSIFQTSVLKKYLNELDQSLIDEKYKAFQQYFGNTEMQARIRDLKEEQFQEGFLRELFVNVLDYTLNPNEGFNLTTEQKNVDDSKKADGAILKDGNVHAVIELKSTQTTDLDTIETQAFGYKNHNPKCVYVVTSNFEKLRFYIQNAVHHIDFDLFNLTRDQFSLLWICLSRDNVLNDLPLKIKEASIIQEEKVTKHLYADYRKFREDLYNNLVEKNPDKNKLELFKKTQKLLDRFLFIFFAEDRLLLPANSISKIIEKWKDDVAFGDDRRLYDIFKKYFNVLYKGRPKSGDREEIFAYNGGLFEPDEMLDNLNIDDEILAEHTLKLTAYDFETDVDVNILGHIFEHSLGEIENIQAEIKGEKVDAQKTRRKKDGIFYTPKYITKYIVDNTIGKLCEDKKVELNITDERFGHSGKRTKKGVDDLQAYRDWLLNLKICDPACGSGAFLNQALEFLISEHRYIDEITAKYHKVPLVLSDVESSILENNIYGVDLNEESVEIAKLSLWLRTAQKGRKLNTLSNNIKCGNSLIDDPEVAGEKAFKWEEEFPEVFTQKKKKAWHITTATHNSRYSQRMFDNYVKLNDPLWLSEKEEMIVTQTLADIVEKDQLNIPAYNICGDHMHLLLVCEKEEVEKIVGKIKAMTARATNIAMGRTQSRSTTRGHAPLSAAVPPATGEADNQPVKKNRGETQTQLWTQKFGCTEIKTEEQLQNTFHYIENNRKKHELPENQELNQLIEKITCTIEHACRTEYKGGFDVVIGNPPYGIFIDKKSQEYYIDHYPLTNYKINLYILFVERMLQIFEKGIVHFIIPKSLLFNTYYKEIRKALIQRANINEIYTITEKVFEDAEVGSSLLLQFVITNKSNPKNTIRLVNADKIENFVSNFGLTENTQPQDYFLKVPNCEISVTSADSKTILRKLHKLNPIKDYYTIKNGLNPGNVKHILISDTKKSENHKPIIWGKDISRYNLNWSGQFINYDENIRNTISLDDIKSKKGMNRQSKIDFALRSPEIFETTKVLVRKTGDSLIACLDDHKYYFDTLVHGIYLIKKEYSLKTLLAILNSKPVTYFYRLLHDIKGKVFAKISLDNLSSFPLPNLSSQENELFSDKVDFLIMKTNDLAALQGSFLGLLKSKFDVNRISKNLKFWYNLSFSDFLKELEKAKVKLSLSEESEWMQYFNEQKQKVQELQAEINQTDKEIDQMVYELYGLTEDEIKIVEQSIK